MTTNTDIHDPVSLHTRVFQELTTQLQILEQMREMYSISLEPSLGYAVQFQTNLVNLLTDTVQYLLTQIPAANEPQLGVPGYEADGAEGTIHNGELR